jgi:hypothetical protein
VTCHWRYKMLSLRRVRDILKHKLRIRYGWVVKETGKEQFDFQETVFYACSQRYEICSRTGKNVSTLPSPQCYHQNLFKIGLSCKQHTD